MMLKIIEPDFIFENECGCLTQLVREGWSQVNVITSVAGSKRGGHYHKINKEGFYVINGRFKLILEELGEGNEKEKLEKENLAKDSIAKEEYIMKAGDMFMIEPYQKHYFEYLEDTTLVSLYDKGVELPRNLKDIYS